MLRLSHIAALAVLLALPACVEPAATGERTTTSPDIRVLMKGAEQSMHRQNAGPPAHDVYWQHDRAVLTYKAAKPLSFAEQKRLIRASTNCLPHAEPFAAFRKGDLQHAAFRLSCRS